MPKAPMGEQVNFEVNEIEIMSGYPKNSNFKSDNYSSDRRCDENLPSRESGMKKFDYIKQSWYIGLFILFWILTIYGTYTISPLVRASFDREQIKAETGQYPIEVINPVSLQQLNDIVKDFNGTIIFSEKGKIVLNK